MAEHIDTVPTDDLSALAWVNSELRRSLENAHKALRRHLKESEAATRSDLDAVDPAGLRSARAQLHQGVGALELVGLPAAARLLRASESAVQRLLARPALVTEKSVHVIERASFALLDYLGRTLAGKPTSPVGLFPQYAAVQALAGADRVHPADLWETDFVWHEVASEPDVQPRAADDAARGSMEAVVLRLMKRPEPHAWARLSTLCTELAAGASGRERTLWQLAAAFAEAESAGLLPQGDVHTKRIAARLLAQLRLSARHQDEPSERLAHDLLFFCAHVRKALSPTPRLDTVRQVWRLPSAEPIDYERERLGRFDPALILQARKRVTGAKDVWSAVAAGEQHRVAGLSEHVALLGDSVDRLFPSGPQLSSVLQKTAARVAATGEVPATALAMEVATAVLYLDATLEDGELDQPDLAQRIERLAQRIREAAAGADPQPLEPWMEELYRRVSDRQTMGSVVHELRASLSEVEKEIDQYFRDPSRRELLIPVPAQLSAMRGVLSVLGMAQASQAVLHMRDNVDELAQTEVDPQHALQSGSFERLADNLGALSFLIDMLGVQPQLAKSLFRFDAAEGRLSAVMGRSERNSAFGGLDALASGSMPLADQAWALADSVAAQPQADHGPALEALGQRALAADLPRVAGAISSAQRALSLAQDEQARQAVGAELVQSVSNLLPATPVAPPVVAAAAPTTANLEDDPEMRDIFLEEAREVIAAARQSLLQLSESPEDVGELTTVRRAFHTLKGSSRMVGLRDYGEAAWACEQLYNARLAQSPRLDGDLQAFTHEALDHLAAWTDAIAGGVGASQGPQAIIAAADSLRVHGQRIPVARRMGDDAAALAEPGPPGDLDGLPILDVPAIPELQVELEPESLELLPLATLVDRVPDLPSARDLELELSALPAPSVPGPDETLPRGPAGEPAQEPLEAPRVESATEPEFELDLGLASVEGAERVVLGAVAETTPLSPASAGGPDSGERIELDFGALELAPAAAVDVPSDNTAIIDLGELTQPLPLGATGQDAVSTAPVEPLDLDFVDLEAQPISAEAPAADQALPVEPELDDSSRAPEPPEAPEVIELDFGEDHSVESTRPLTTEWAGPTESAGILLPPGPQEAGPPVAAEDLAMDAAARAAQAVEPDTAVEPAEEVASAALPADTAIDAAADEQVKVIESLRIPIPLFNIYLNEADELSRRLSTELAEWSLECDRRPVPDSSIVLAHSLAGSSATVGYGDLSALARALEHVLLRAAASGPTQDGEAALYNEAADEIRRLLHQFAAGFLRPMVPGLVERLRELEIRLADRHPMSLAGPLSEVTEVPVPMLLRPADDAAEPETWVTRPIATPQATSFAALDARPASTAARARADAFDDDEDIEAADAIDAELFPIFEEEAEELLPQLQARLRDWSLSPSDASAPAACMRTLHTFKGGARLAGAMRLGEMAHRLETAIEHLTGQGHPDAQRVESLQARADSMAAAFESLRRPSAHAAAAAAAPAPATQAVPVEWPVPAAATEPPLEAAAAAAGDAALAAPVAEAAASPAAQPAATEVDWARFDDRRIAAPLVPERTAVGAPAVRVRAALLDRLVNHAGEVSITRARLDSDVRQLQGAVNDLTDNLDRLRSQLRDIELQAESQIGSRIEAAKAASQAFDPLEMDRFTRFQELTRMMAEAVNDVATVQRSVQRTLQSTEDELAAQARLTRELQDDLLRTRMVEFESLSERLYRVVRQAAKDSGKQVRLDIVGGSIEVDRGVLERMVGPFEHLLRNCVAHGIEPAAQRLAAAKDPTGEIRITVSQEGNEIGVDCRDDGAGLDLQRIRQRAQERGLHQADQPVSDAELVNLIFQPGFSTASEVNELAGRGVGLDVVRAEVNAMGGRIETASTPGQGTSFRLVLPLTTAVTQVVMLRCGELRVAVPSTLIEVVRRVPTAQVEQAYAAGGYDVGDQVVPFYWLGALLEHSARGPDTGRTQAIVVVRSAAQRVALHVDEVLGNQEVVVKHIGPQLARLPGLAGVTLLPSGAVALIYNPVALAALFGASAQQRSQQAPLQAPAGAVPESAAVDSAPLVLVVDDSLTVRRVTQRLLVREGYRVALAKDGMDALEKLALERPAILLSDIEMPRMDGFDLVRNVRADARLTGLPVVMITSRIAQKHRDYAAELGVDHYLGKPYSEDELLRLVARHAGAGVSA